VNNSESREAMIAAAYDRHADMMYRLALSHLQNSEDAADAVQDVFVKFITSTPEFNTPEHEKAWFIRATVNRCYDLLRRRGVRDYVDLDEISEVLPDSETLHDPDERGDVMRLLSLIPEKNRAAVVLHYLEGYSVERTAKALGIGVSAVKMRLARAREALRGRLGE